MRRFVASFGSGEAGERTCEWLGTTRFFGHNGEGETLRYLADSGLRVRDSSAETQDNEQASLMGVEAIKNRRPSTCHVPGTIVDPGHRLGYFASAQLVIKAGNSSSQQWSRKN
jgi:hypothetical protein